MADGPVNPEENKRETDRYKVDVINPREIYDLLIGNPPGKWIVSDEKFKSPAFDAETTFVELLPTGYYDRPNHSWIISTVFDQTEDRVSFGDQGFYDLDELDEIRDLLSKRGLAVSIQSRRGHLRSLFVQKNDVCVMINLGSEINFQDSVFVDESIASRQEEEAKNYWVTMFLISKDSLAKPEFEFPEAPENFEEFLYSLNSYADIMGHFMNVMGIEKGSTYPQETIIIKPTTQFTKSE